MSTRVRALLLTLAGAPLLLCCATTATAKRSKQPAAPTEVIEVELREIGGNNQSRDFLVPVDGHIAGSVLLFDEPGRCELESSPRADERLHLELRCSRPDLALETTRSLPLGAPTILGEIELGDDHRLRVLATRR